MTYFFLLKSSQNFHKFHWAYKNHLQEGLQTDSDTTAEIKLCQHGTAFKPHAASLHFQRASQVFNSVSRESVTTGTAHTSVSSHWLGCVGLCVAQQQHLGQVLQNEATEKHTSPQLGAPTTGLQQPCASPTAHGSAQAPLRAASPTAPLRSTVPNRRMQPVPLNTPKTREHEIRHRINMGTHSTGEHTLLFIYGCKSANLTSSLHVHLCIFCPTHINLCLSLIFYDLSLIPLHYALKREQNSY